jgi:hypothetical protein
LTRIGENRCLSEFAMASPCSCLGSHFHFIWDLALGICA